MFKIAKTRGCLRASLFYIPNPVLALVLIAAVLCSCSSEKPQIQEARIWRLHEYDTASKTAKDSLLVQVRLNSDQVFKELKEVALLHEQASLYWVIPAGDLDLITINDQPWICLSRITWPALEKPFFGKYTVYMESFSGDSVYMDIELPGVAYRTISPEPLVENGFISALDENTQARAYREVVLKDKSGNEVLRSAVKSRVDIKSIFRLGHAPGLSLYIQDFYPQDGILVSSGPWLQKL